MTDKKKSDLFPSGLVQPSPSRTRNNLVDGGGQMQGGWRQQDDGGVGRKSSRSRRVCRGSREKLNVEGGEGRHRGWWRGQRGSDTRKAGWEHTGQSFKTDAQDQSKEKEEAGHVSPRERIPALLMGPAAGITWAVRIPHCQELESPHPRGRLPQALVPPSLPPSWVPRVAGTSLQLDRGHSQPPAPATSPTLSPGT